MPLASLLQKSQLHIFLQLHHTLPLPHLRNHYNTRYVISYLCDILGAQIKQIVRRHQKRMKKEKKKEGTYSNSEAKEIKRQGRKKRKEQS